MTFEFSLPFCILLADGDYKVRITEGDDVTLRLTEKIPDNYDERLGMCNLLASDLQGYEKVRVMNVENDFEGVRAREISVNEIMAVKEGLMIEALVKDNMNYPTPTWLFLNQEVPYDRFGRFRYTKVTFISENNDDLLQRALSAINKLIVNYRAYTNHFWVAQITAKDLEVFASSCKTATLSPLIKFLPKADAKTTDSIKNAIMGDNSEIPSHMLYLDARNAFVQMNFTLSLIYSITSIEATVKSFLRLYSYTHKIKGVSKKNLLKTPIYNAVTVILRLLVSRDELPDDFITEFIEINKVRNEIIHQARLSVDRPTANKALHVVEKFTVILNPKIADLLQEHLKEYHANDHKVT